MPIIDIFVYGTLRADYTSHNGFSIVQELAPGHVLSGDPGSYTLHDYGLYCLKGDGSIGIPAIGQQEGCRVIGDVIRVNADDFTSLARYESFPDLYQLAGVEVCSEHGTWRQAFAFVPMPHTLHMFGMLLPSGDFVTARNRHLTMTAD